MKKVIAAILILATLSACKDTKEAPQPPAQTKENITGVYKITALTLTTSSSAETDVLNSYLTTCQRDDLQQLKLDLTYNYIDAGVACSPTGDKAGTWSLPSTGKITINGQAGDIVSFSGTVLVVSRVESVMGTATTFKFTFTKQ